MRLSFRQVIVTGLCATLMGISLLCGCSGASTVVDDEAAQNRQFMASVNQIMVAMQSSFDGFNEAVGSGDIVAMKFRLDSVSDCIGQLDKLDAPEDLADIKQNYVEGVTALQSAIEAYTALYSEIASTEDRSAVDMSSFADRLSEINATYQDGIAKLQAGDEAAASKE